MASSPGAVFSLRTIRLFGAWTWARHEATTVSVSDDCVVRGDKLLDSMPQQHRLYMAREPHLRQLLLSRIRQGHAYVQDKVWRANCSESRMLDSGTGRWSYKIPIEIHHFLN